MSLGLIMYFYYGISHSLLENPTEEIELTVDQTYLKTPTQKVIKLILIKREIIELIVCYCVAQQQEQRKKNREGSSLGAGSPWL